MYKRWLYIFALAVSAAIFGSSCKPSPIQQADMREEIDTLVQREVEKIELEMDSVCAAHAEEWERTFVDSVLALRTRQVLGKLQSVHEQ